MKNAYIIMLMLSIYGCSTEDTSTSSNHVESTNTITRNYDRQIFILSFEQGDRISKKDTLIVHKNADQECVVLWKSDTIVRGSTYERSVDFISCLGAVGYSNVFIMQIYEGDGCPGTYKILQFKNDSTYFLSNAFGNCEPPSILKLRWPEIEFTFAASVLPERRAMRYIFNYVNVTLKEYD